MVKFLLSACVVRRTGISLTVAICAVFVVFLTCVSFEISAQTIVTQQAGPWNVGSTWAGGVVPTAANSTAIQVSHNVNIPSSFTATVDQVSVDPGIDLTVDSGGTLNLQNSGAGTDLTLSEDFVILFIGANLIVSGDFINNSTTAVDYGSGLSTTVFNSGGRYVHAVNGLTLPFNGTTWNVNSTCEVTGVTTTAPGNTNQTFGNFTWNCANQSPVNLVLGLNAATINGNLSILSTKGPGIVTLANTAGTVTINKDFIISGNSRFLGSTTVNETINVLGNFSFSSTAANQSFLITSTAVLNLNVAKNFTVSSGNLQSRAVASATANVNFNGSTVQNYNTSGGTLTGFFNWTVKNGSTVDPTTNPFIGGGNFTLEAGGTLKVGSPDGLSTGVSIGNVRVSGTRTYTANGNIIYNSASAQNLGDEWGASGALNGVAVNFEVASGNTVTNNIIGSTSVVGKLTLTSGSFAIGNSNTLQIQGNYAGNGGTITGDATSTLVFTSSGTTTGTLKFASGFENLNTLSIARAGTIVLATPLTISTTGSLAFSSTGNLQIDGQTLTINGNMTKTGAGGLISTVSSTNLIIGGSGALSALPFTGSMQLNNVSFNRSGGATYAWSSTGNVNGTLDLSAGTLNHSSGLNMVSGSTFSRSSGTSISGSAPGTSGSYNVTYVGDLTTSLELPSSSTALANLTIGGNDILDKPITVNGDLNINSGTLTAGGNDVTIAGANFLVNSGSFTINSGGTVTFSKAGSTTLGGSSLSGIQFGNLTINSGTTLVVSNLVSPIIKVSGTWDNGGGFTPNTSAVNFNGGPQGIDANGQPFNSVTFSGTGTKTLQGPLVATGALIISTGATLDVGSNFPITVAGSWLNSGTFTADAGTVTFNGAGQVINSAGQPFFNLTLSNSGTKLLSAAIDINGALTIDPGVTFDVSSTSYAVNVAGNWINNGTFTKRTGLVTFDGITSISGSAATSFHHVTITGSLTAASGTTNVSGDWLQSSGSFTANGGTLNFNGATQAITPGGQQFNAVTIASTVSSTLQGAAVFTGPLTFSSGTFNSNGNTMDLKGDLVSNAASTLTASAITFSGTTTISGGTAPTFGGITVSGTLTPTASFNVNGALVNNGTLNASAGTVTFGGTTTISGTNACSFNNVTINGILTAPSGNLNVAGNWSNSGTFSASGGTITFTGTTSISGSSTSNFANIALSGTLNAPPILNVAGNFANSGTFNRGTGTVFFNGFATQSVSGSSVTDFNNITVSNNSVPAVQIQSNQNLRGVLTLSGTTTVFDADGSSNTSVFKVMSSADSPTVDASIAALPVGTSVTGNVTVQRFMSIEGANSGRIYRYISAPVIGAPVSQIQAFIPVSGSFSGASSAALQSMFAYDETVTTDTNASGIADLNDGYINFPAAANSETFAPGVGYSIFVRGNVAPVSTAGSALWELTGPINSGNVSLPVSFTSSGTAANDGWNLVGNPYPSTIDWNAGGWTKTNINDALYVLDNGQNSPVFATYIGGVGANGGTRYIAAGQAFYVKGGGGAPALAVSESVKVAGTQTTFIRQAAVTDMVRITLRHGNVADEAVIRFKDDATSTFDNLWDAHKLTNPGTFNLSSLTSDDKKLAINAMPALQSCTASVKLDVSDVTAGSYTLDFSDLDGFTQANTKLVLVDSYTTQTQDIRAINSYAFQVTTDPASFGSNRFSLSVGEATATITATNGSVCDKGSVTLTASGATEGNYRWYSSATGGAAIGGATGSIFVTPVLTSATTYYVAPANAAGCTGARIPVLADVKIVQPVVLTVSGKLLQSSYTQGNQWYVDGQLIPGATDQTYEPVKTGIYKVVATTTTCTTSAEREFVVTGLEDKLPSHISIYPNPTQGDVSLAVKSTNEVSAKVLSITGIEIQNKLLEGTSVKKGSFNLEDQSDGMYILIVQDGNQTYKTRIIKKR